MTFTDFDLVISIPSIKKTGFILKWIDAKRPEPYTSNEYHIYFKFIDISDIVENGIKFWSIDYIHRYRESERIYPFRFAAEEEVLSVYMKLPTIEKLVEMKFPFAELTILPKPEHKQSEQPDAVTESGD